jgi:hypothetical protein
MMKNILLKTCLTALALSVAGLANSQAADMTLDDMLTYSVISGGAVNIAAQPDYVTAPSVGGHLAGQAAVTIGAFTTVNDIYAGAAVTTGASSRVKQIFAGAAAGVGANAFAHDITAGTAVVVGANGQVGTITAGAAITLGAGVGHKVGNDYTGVVTRGAGSTVMHYLGDYSDTYHDWATAAGTSTGKIKKADDMAIAKQNIETMLAKTALVTPGNVDTNTDLSSSSIGNDGTTETFHYSAINLQADTDLTIRGNVTVIISENMTIGAGAEIVLAQDAIVTWILGGSLNLGAGSTFSGETYVDGAINGATSDIECGNLYATGAVSVRTIGDSCAQPVRDAVCPAWTLAELEFSFLAQQQRTQESSLRYSRGRGVGGTVEGTLRDLDNNNLRREWHITAHALDNELFYQEWIGFGDHLIFEKQYRVYPSHPEHIRITSSQYTACQEIVGQAWLNLP